MNKPEPHRWLVPVRRVRDPALSMLLLPHAGGGPGVFRSWGDVFGTDVEALAVQLPGRDARFTEAPFHRMAPLIAELSSAVIARIEGPCALFGHSMGAAIAFELARRLRDLGREPQWLFVSALSGPRAIRRMSPPTYTLSDRAFLEEVRQMGGAPPGAFGPAELWQTFLPALKADFELIETWMPAPARPLSCPVVALRGFDDPLVSDAGLEAWRHETSGEFRSVRFAGDHFYYLRCPPLFDLFTRCVGGAPRSVPT